MEMTALLLGVACATIVGLTGVLVWQQRRLKRQAPPPGPAQSNDASETLARLDVWMQQLMLSAEHQEQFYSLVSTATLDLAGADTAAFSLLDPDTGRHEYRAAVGANANALVGTTHRLEAECMFQWVGSHRVSLRLEDFRRSPRGASHLACLQASSSLVVPILNRGRVTGFLCAFRDQRGFGQMDEELLAVFGQKVAIAMHNMRLIASLEAEKERAEVTLHSIGDAVITTDAEGRVDYLNPVAERLTGWTTIEAQGETVETVFQVINEITRERVSDPVGRCLAEGKVVGIPTQSALVRRDGREFSIDDSAAPIRERDGAVVGAVLVFHDVSRARRMARELSWQARHDRLTGLANRTHFEEALRLAVDDARENDHEHVVLYLDLDQFKVVNDTCGHVAGDELVRQLALRLRGRVRELDTLARFGGDEFGVLLVGCHLDQGRRIADKLQETIREFQFNWQDHVFDVGASIGVAAITSRSQSAATALSAADIACHVAKENGRNRVHVFREGDSTLAKRRGEMMWVSRITSALAADRFVLWAQPIVSTTDDPDAPQHLEILVRMVEESGKIVAPGFFIPAAERYNLMGQIDRWVVRNVFERFSGRLGSGRGEVPMCAINLSGASMSDETLLDFIREQFASHDVPPASICFEITETAAVGNLEQAAAFISELKEMGCRFALDDFGSGLSSFAYLRQLPVDFIKIDGFFVKDMLQQPMNRAIVEAIQRIGNVMGIRTIAEFVEDSATLDALRKIGVDYGQGYGICRPAPLEELLRPVVQLAAVG